MADSPLTEALAEYDEFGFVGVHQQDALAAAARKWAELEALVADGGRVVVEMPCSCEPFKHSGPVKGSIWLGDQWVPLNCDGLSRRIIIGEGATE